jgi:glycosyltransferase involved in cell wall biosynthesis
MSTVTSAFPESKRGTARSGPIRRATTTIVTHQNRPLHPLNIPFTKALNKKNLAKKGSHMRIAQVAPLTESVPPKTYGGTERIVSYLTDALVDLGHEVTLYASGDSVTRATLKACHPCALRADAEQPGPDMPHQRMMLRVLNDADAYDVIHFHVGWFEFPLFAPLAHKCLTTLHGRLDVPSAQERLSQYPSFPLVSISNAQRLPLPHLAWQGTIYHGLPQELMPEPVAERDYVVFLGRISPEKRPDLAIDIARRAGISIKIAAKVDRADLEYHEAVIRPLLDLPGVEFLGELGEHDKMTLLAGAKALLFPIDWPEPFGLVMIEAMACGTPVIAFRRGSVPELITDGVTGFIVGTASEAVESVNQIDRLDVRHIRDIFRQRFTAERMAQDHVYQYRALLAAGVSAEGTAAD